MYCPKCGKALADNAIMCPGCGNRFAPINQPPKKKKKKWWIFVLVFLGICIILSLFSGDDKDSADKSSTQSAPAVKQETESQKESQKESEQTELTKDDYIALCESFGYEDILRKPDSYEDKYCKVDGTVNQIIEGFFGSFTIFIEDANGNLWGTTYYYKDDEEHLLEGDKVSGYGICAGTDTVETVLGKQTTLPRVDLEYIERK